MASKVKNVGFPDPLAPDTEKNTDDYALKWAKAIEHEWWFQPDTGVGRYSDKRDKYHRLRLYSRGEQGTDLYKELLTGGSGESGTYTNYDWRPLQIIPKFVKLITNQMAERLFKVKAKAIDSVSMTKRDQKQKELERNMRGKPMMMDAKETLGVDVTPSNPDEMPDTQEEVDLLMKLKYKPKIEIAVEESLQYTFDLNEFDEVKAKVLQDSVDIGVGALKHYTDPNQGIKIEYVDPAEMVYAYPTHRNFKDVYYYGEVKRMTIAELKRISGDKFSDKELLDLAKGSDEWDSYIRESNQYHYRENDIDGMMCDIMFFTFKATNTVTYKKKNNKNGGYKMTKKDSSFQNPSGSYKGYSAVKKNIDVWYEGAFVLGTDMVFNYGLAKNMVRPKGKLNMTHPSYIVYAPEMYQNRTIGLVERMITYVDQMQQTHIKLQQRIAKARPSGIYVDVDGMSEIDFGDGNFLTPMELIKIYDETGNVLGSSITAEGDYNYGKEPIKELRNTLDGIEPLINVYNHYLNLLRDAIGIPAGQDGSNPHPDTLVGVQNQVALNSNTATRHFLDGVLNICQRLSEGMVLRLQDLFEYSDLKDAYINSIGKENVDMIKSLNNLHLHDFGIKTYLKPDLEEKNLLEQNIQVALQRELITLDDAIDIREVDNIKLANQLLKIRRQKRDETKREQEKELIDRNAQAQQQSAQQASQARMQELQMQSQLEAQKVQMMTQAELQKIQAQSQADSQLAEQKFQYDMQLKQLEVQGKTDVDSMKEDGKLKRQDRNNTQASKMIEQRHTNQSPLDFEGGEGEVGDIDEDLGINI